MKYYVIIENNEIVDWSNCPSSKENTISVEISYEVYCNINKYIWDKKNKELIVKPNYDAEQLKQVKIYKNLENTMKAKMAVENGYVEFKNAQFETNAQTVGDLTATERMMEKYGIETYDWLSRDDKVITLSLADFGTLGSLIAGYKAHIWNEEYLTYKQQINNAETVEEVEAIEIIY